MSIELTLQIFFTFRRRRGLYFWSLLVCTWGIVLHVLGVILKLFNEGNWIISSIIFKFGWVGNVTGYSLVLYSRLNLIVHSRRIRRVVLAMIITDAIIFHTPIIIFDFGISSPHPDIWYLPMKVMERIQVIGFGIQETIISLMYIFYTRGFLKDTYSHQTHRVMLLLISAQAVAIIFDIVLITVDCNNMFILKVVLHPFAYAIKLKFEFVVLNQLLALIKHGVAPSNFPAPDEESPDASGPTPPRSGGVRNGKHASFVSSRTATNEGDRPRKDSVALPTGVLQRDMEYYESKGNNGDSGEKDNQASGKPVPNSNPDAIETLPLPTATSTAIPRQTPALTMSRAAKLGTPEATVTERSSFEAPVPMRSFSDPMPLSAAQREQDSDSIVAQIERQYLGNWNG